MWLLKYLDGDTNSDLPILGHVSSVLLDSISLAQTWSNNI